MTDQKVIQNRELNIWEALLMVIVLVGIVVNNAIVLVDARKGVIEQTCRHAFIANLLRIQHVVVCVNKMDLVDLVGVPIFDATFFKWIALHK